MKQLRPGLLDQFVTDYGFNELATAISLSMLLLEPLQPKKAKALDLTHYSRSVIVKSN